jgi:hypothetical protein
MEVDDWVGEGAGHFWHSLRFRLSKSTRAAETFGISPMPFAFCLGFPNLLTSNNCTRRKLSICCCGINFALGESEVRPEGWMSRSVMIAVETTNLSRQIVGLLETHS